MNHQETIEYVIDEMKGKPVYVGRSVNYNCCCQGDSVEDLKNKMASMIRMWLKFGEDTMALPEPLDMKEITHETWEEKDKEWMVTSKWMSIANAFYDKLNGIPKGKFELDFDEATALYESLTTRRVVTDKLKEK